MRSMRCRHLVRLAAGLATVPLHTSYATPAPDSKVSSSTHVLVVGSINIDLYKKVPSQVEFDGKGINIETIKGMTLPAKSFVNNRQIAMALRGAGLICPAGAEEAMVLRMEGPFDQKTGGKGANAAAAAGQTFPCEFIGNLGKASAAANRSLLADMKAFGSVRTDRCSLIDGPTGTAYILLFEDGDNAILLLGGANQQWATKDALLKGSEGASLRNAIESSVAVMLQREVPDHVNIAVAEYSRAHGKPVFMDVGGTDAPLDPALLPYLSVLAPNESELTFISGVSTTEGGVITKSRLRAAVAALKTQASAAGNTDLEVLVTLGSTGSMHFGKDWVNNGVEVAGMLPHETQMGRFSLGTPSRAPCDTTGAGDCFRGSYVAARYGEGMAVADAMRWAAAAGSLAVEIEGAMPSMPPRSKIEERCRGEVSASLAN